MSDPQTIRELWERVRERHSDTTVICTAPNNVYQLCEVCRDTYPCLDYRDAVAALDLLDSAERAGRPGQRIRIWPEDDRRLVPDPAPRGDAE